jgi:histidyl-tRNA synthetase
VDAELILLARSFWERLGVAGHVWLEINTLGSGEARAAYRDALVRYLEPFREDLDEDSRRRLGRNPLRILDSKDPRTREILADAPSLPDFVDDAGRTHFAGLCAMLETLSVPFQVNPQLVRGLDYYTHTVFEWTTDALGSQGAVCAGGRYDGLVERLGGRSTPAAGFAVGLDRVILLHEAVGAGSGAPAALQAAADVYICVMAPEHHAWSLSLGDKLRSALPGFRIRTHAGGGKMKNQMKRADQSGARYALVIGDDEVRSGCPTLKYLREDRPQESLPVEAVIQRLAGGS